LNYLGRGCLIRIAWGTVRTFRSYFCTNWIK